MRTKRARQRRGSKIFERLQQRSLLRYLAPAIRKSEASMGVPLIETFDDRARNMTQSMAINRILFIDDDDVDQLMYKRLIERSGLAASMESFLYAEDALQYLVTNDYNLEDVIVLDIKMPRMTGFEFIDALRATELDLAAITIVMLTTSTDQTDREKAVQYDEIKGFFIKPLTESHLQEIASLVTARRAAAASD